MKQSEFTFPTMEFNGYDLTSKFAQMSHIFNKEQIEAINDQCGRSIYFTHVATELIKGRVQD